MKADIFSYVLMFGFFIPRGVLSDPQGGYRNTLRPCVRPCVWAHSSEMAERIFTKLIDMIKYHPWIMPVFLKFWKNSRWPSAIEKIGKKLPFSPILAHFKLYLRQKRFNSPDIDIIGGEQLKVTILIIFRVIRLKMADGWQF